MFVEEIVRAMSNTPDFLEEMLEGISETELKERRIKRKWSIHEHVIHLAQSQEMMLERFRMFNDIKPAVFEPYTPGKEGQFPDLRNEDLPSAVIDFRTKRNQLIKLIHDLDPDKWTRPARHPGYKTYSAYIFLRHILMHDHLHLYCIEELWLSRNSYLL